MNHHPILCGAVLGIILFGLAPSPLPAAEPAADATAIYRTQVAQEGVLSETNAFVDELQSLLSELETSGLASDAAPEAKRVVAELSEVASGQINAVVTLLGSARSGDQAAARERLLEALRAQTDISKRLEILAAELEAKREFESLADRLSELLKRQVLVRHVLLPFAKEGGPGKLNDARKASLEAAGLQQARLSADAEGLPSLLKRVAIGAEGPRAGLLAQMGKLFEQHGASGAAKNAVERIAAADYPKAVTAQIALEDTFAAMLAVLRSNEADAAEAMRETAENLKALAEEQRDLAKRTETADRRDVPGLAAEERDLAAQTDAARREMEAVAPAVARKLEEATDTMAAVADTLAKGKPDLSKAAEEQEQAAAALDALSENLQAAAEAVQPDVTPADEQYRQLAELANAVEQAREENKQVAGQETAAANQPGEQAEPAMAQAAEKREALAEAVRGLQEKSAEASTAAAEALAQAGEAMENAASDPASSQPNAAAADQALAQAGEALQAEMQATAPQVAESQQLQKTAAQIESAKAAAEAAGAALADEARPNAHADAAVGFRQAAMAAQALAAATQESQPGVSEPMGQAAQALAQASAQSAQGKSEAAAEAAANAMAGLESAGAAVAERMAELAGAPSPAQQAAMAPGPEGAPITGIEGMDGAATGAEKSGQGSVTGFIPGGPGGGAEVAMVTGSLTPSEREALNLMRSEPAPAGYEADVEQYFLNLAGATGE